MKAGVFALALLLYTVPKTVCTPPPPLSSRTHWIDVDKCCGRGFQLHASEDECIPRSGSESDSTDWQFLYPPMDETAVYWLPESLRLQTVQVTYDALNSRSRGDLASSAKEKRLSVSARVEAKESAVERFLQMKAGTRRFELTAFKGRVSPFAVRRQKFCFDASTDDNTPNVILTTVELRSVAKCCPKNFQLNENAEDCVPLRGGSRSDVSEELINYYENPKAAKWLPHKLRDSIIVALYGKLPLLRWNVRVSATAFVEHEDEEEVDEEDEEENENKRNFNYEVKRNRQSWQLHDDTAGYKIRINGNSRTGDTVEGTATEFCFDLVAEGPLPPRLVLARLWTLNKCCGKGEQLDANATICVRRPGSLARDVDFEQLKRVAASSDNKWLPPDFRADGALVGYFREKDRGWFSKRHVISAEDSDQWEIQYSKETEPKVLIMASDRQGNTVRTQAAVFCFDVLSGGLRVLLTVFSEVNKCCRKDEQLDVLASKCVPRLGTVGDDEEFGIVNLEKDPDSAFWVPSILRDKLLPVRYEFGLMEKGGVVFLAEHKGRWKLELSDGEPTVSISSTTISGADVKVQTTKFCFDAIDRGPRALVADVCFHEDFNCFFKCCPLGKLLSSDGNCMDNNGSDWSSRDSVASKFLNGEGMYGAKVLSHPICGTSAFYVQDAPTSPEEFAERLRSKSLKYRFSKTFFCVDFHEEDDNTEEVLAYCVAPPVAPVYEMIRPLNVLAVLLLAVALAAILVPQSSRSSTHGQALACHALCLLAANALQASWFFFDKTDHYCKYYAYAIYYFLVAAGLWLNAISINLLRGFKQPLGAMAGGRRRNRRSRRFLFLSLYSWGASVVLTAVCVHMHLNEETYEPQGLVVPSLFETRTCFFEVLYTENLRKGKVKKTGDNLGALAYFYAPMAVLVVANAVCLALTTWNIRTLKKDAALVQRTGSSTSSAPSGFQSALLYVKLLLTAGVLELVVEGVAWGARPRRFHGSADWAEEYAAQNAFVFAIVGVFVDVGRALAVLWLCAGQWRWAGAARARLRGAAAWLRAGLRRRSQRRVAPPAPSTKSVVLEERSSSSATADTAVSSSSISSL